jgi:hypothetical protein
MSKNNNLIKQYEVHLPVFKQGDDMAWHLEENDNNPVKSFQGLADQYLSAAKQCNQISEFLAMAGDLSDVSVDADTHCIWLSAPEKMVEPLLKEKVISPSMFDDEDDEEFDDEEEYDDQ